MPNRKTVHTAQDIRRLIFCCLFVFFSASASWSQSVNLPLDRWVYTHHLHRNFQVSISWEQRRRAQNDITEGIPTEDNRTKFLDGVVEKNRYYGINGEWQIKRDIFLSAFYQYIQSDNLRRDSDADQNNHRVFLRASLNY